MHSYTLIKNQAFLRFVSRVIPLKHKLNFLVKQYLVNGTDLAIRYYKDWFVCTTVNDSNRSTIEEVILGGTFSQPECDLIKQLQHGLPDNMVFIDVGGNIGTFLCQFVDKCDQVFVFEPIPKLANVIKRSIAYNKATNITLIEKAVGDQPGHVKMLDNNNSNIVNNESADNSIDIEVTTLDHECKELSKVDFIKIDVEGYETNVLKGARELIKKFRPRLLIEVHPMYLENYGHHHTDVIHFLEENNYSIKYYSYLEEQRMAKLQRIISRWNGNKGIQFADKEAYLKDIPKEPRISSYHFYCEPN